MTQPWQPGTPRHLIRLSHAYLGDIGSLHVIDYYLYLATKTGGSYHWYGSPRTMTQREYDEERSGVYR